MWVSHSTPETKQQSMVWKTMKENMPKKVKVTHSTEKAMAMVFWNTLHSGVTINTEKYCNIEKSAICNKSEMALIIEQHSFWSTKTHIPILCESICEVLPM